MKILFSVSQLHSQAVHQPDCHVWLFGRSDRILLPPLETYAQYSVSASQTVSAGLCAGLSLEDNWEAPARTPGERQCWPQVTEHHGSAGLLHSQASVGSLYFMIWQTTMHEDLWRCIHSCAFSEQVWCLLADSFQLVWDLATLAINLKGHLSDH